MSIVCEDARLMISIQAEGDLPKSDMVTLNNHLMGCPKCAAYQRDILQIQAKLTASLPENAQYADITDLVMSQIPVKASKPRFSFKPLWLLAPGLCVLVLAAIFAGNRVHKPASHKMARRGAAPVVQVKKFPEPGKPAVRIAQDTAPGRLAPAKPHSEPKHLRSAPEPVIKPEKPAIEEPVETPAEPPAVASAPVEPQTPAPGRVHLESPDPETIHGPQTTSACVCVDVPTPDGVRPAPLYRIPVRAPRRPVSLALNAHEEETL